jgi:hypothetical protein
MSLILRTYRGRCRRCSWWQLCLSPRGQTYTQSRPGHKQAVQNAANRKASVRGEGGGRMVAWDERHCELEMDGIGREDDSNSKREHARRIYRTASRVGKDGVEPSLQFRCGPAGICHRALSGLVFATPAGELARNLSLTSNPPPHPRSLRPQASQLAWYDLSAASPSLSKPLTPRRACDAFAARPLALTPPCLHISTRGRARPCRSLPLPSPSLSS